ncbi:hypothetical protein ACWKSP_00845 [Micromonosporaceae bacterium Da 78-11]
MPQTVSVLQTVIALSVVACAAVCLLLRVRRRRLLGSALRPVDPPTPVPAVRVPLPRRPADTDTVIAAPAPTVTAVAAPTVVPERPVTPGRPVTQTAPIAPAAVSASAAAGASVAAEAPTAPARPVTAPPQAVASAASPRGLKNNGASHFRRSPRTALPAGS